MTDPSSRMIEEMQKHSNAVDLKKSVKNVLLSNKRRKKGMIEIMRHSGI